MRRRTHDFQVQLAFRLNAVLVWTTCTAACRASRTHSGASPLVPRAACSLSSRLIMTVVSSRPCRTDPNRCTISTSLSRRNFRRTQ